MIGEERPPRQRTRRGESARNGDPVRLDQSLGRLVRTLGWADRAEAVGVLARWDDIVGPDIAARARPVSLDGGVLTIAVDDPTWASQLGWMERQLLDQLEAGGAGRLERLVIRVRHARPPRQPG